MLKHNIWDVEHEKNILFVDKFIFINLILWKFGIFLKNPRAVKKSNKLASIFKTQKSLFTDYSRKYCAISSRELFFVKKRKENNSNNNNSKA